MCLRTFSSTFLFSTTGRWTGVGIFIFILYHDSKLRSPALAFTQLFLLWENVSLSPLVQPHSSICAKEKAISYSSNSSHRVGPLMLLSLILPGRFLHSPGNGCLVQSFGIQPILLSWWQKSFWKTGRLGPLSSPISPHSCL